MLSRRSRERKRRNRLYEQELNGQPFFVQGDWERVEELGEQAITAMVFKRRRA